MVTPAICLIKQLATTSFFGYVFGYHFIFQGLEFDDCVFLLRRQCGESRRFRTLKLSEWVYPSACCKVQKHYLGSLTPHLKLETLPRAK